MSEKTVRPPTHKHKRARAHTLPFSFKNATRLQNFLWTSTLINAQSKLFGNNQDCSNDVSEQVKNPVLAMNHF